MKYRENQYLALQYTILVELYQTLDDIKHPTSSVDKIRKLVGNHPSA
jgi:hypothetical protein